MRSQSYPVINNNELRARTERVMADGCMSTNDQVLVNYIMNASAVKLKKKIHPELSYCSS